MPKRSVSESDFCSLAVAALETRDQLRGVLPHLDRAMRDCEPGALRDGLTQARLIVETGANRLRVALKARKPGAPRATRNSLPCWSRT